MRTIKIVALLGCFVWAGCATSAVTELRDNAFTSSMMTSIACLPFIKGRQCLDAVATDNALLDCSVSSIQHSAAFYAPGASQEISDALHEELKKKYGAAVKDYSASASVFEELSAKQPRSTLRALATACARELGADYVVVGVLDSYIERRGTDRGIDSPASVAFRLYLLHAPTGALVFEGSFNETQQSLSENVLKARVFFKRGARWLTAQELARDGITGILAKIP
jgi:hypothetical protein